MGLKYDNKSFVGEEIRLRKIIMFFGGNPRERQVRTNTHSVDREGIEHETELSPFENKDGKGGRKKESQNRGLLWFSIPFRGFLPNQLQEGVDR